MAARKNPSTVEKRIAQPTTLPKDLHDRLNSEAAARLLSPSLIVERALVEFFERLAPVSSLDAPSAE